MSSPIRRPSTARAIIPAISQSAHSRDWAELFNLRYRMLLKYLGHTFRLARTQHGDSPNLRSMVMHRVFGEMYNLKAIAAIIVRQPLSNDSQRAGPPFEMPYALSLPDTERDIWASHRDLLAMAQRLCKKMLAHEDRGGHAYLQALFAIDSDARAWAESILAALARWKDPRHDDPGTSHPSALRHRRLGSAHEPLDNYTIENDPENPLGFRQIVVAPTLIVDETTGEIREQRVSEKVTFKQGERIRPVAPFLEVFAVTGEDHLEPLTLELLHRIGLDETNISWRTRVANRKVFRRTGDPKDVVTAETDWFSNHAPHRLKGSCENFISDDSFIDFGHVRYIKPNEKTSPGSGCASHPQRA